MQIKGKVAIITGAASGIGRATASLLAERDIMGIGLVDMSEAVHEVAEEINAADSGKQARAFVGDTTDESFRKHVFDTMKADYGTVNILIPAAGITRDALAVKIDKETGKSRMYPVEKFRQVVEVNLTAPVYWALELISQHAEDRFARGLKKWHPDEGLQGAIIMIGSVSSTGNKGQVSYASTKAGIEGAAATLMKEAIFYGVRCGVIHPGYTDTPMVRAMGEDLIDKLILPSTQIKRLIRPEEIADAICFMVSNSAVSGNLWADAGWHAPPV